MRAFVMASGASGIAAVGLGAFGAHLLADPLASRGTTALWQTAVLYHLVHSVALLAVSAGPARSRWLTWAARGWSIGMVLFSGSLYALALGGLGPVFGPITPVGGLGLIAGWVCVLGHGWKSSAGP